MKKPRARPEEVNDHLKTEDEAQFYHWGHKGDRLQEGKFSLKHFDTEDPTGSVQCSVSEFNRSCAFCERTNQP